MTLEALIADIAAKGFKVTNLFELDKGDWQANLRTGPGFLCKFYEFAVGATAQEALASALKKAEGQGQRLKQPPPIMHTEDKNLDIFS